MVDIEVDGLELVDVVVVDRFGGGPFLPSQVRLAAMAKQTSELVLTQTTACTDMAYDNSDQNCCRKVVAPSLLERAVTNDLW